jgi:hypothetical protein
VIVQTNLDIVSNKSASETDFYGHSCGREFLTIQCTECGKRHFVLAGSRDRTCPACARELYRRVYDRYKPAIKSARDLKFVTLTWKPVKRQDPRIVRRLGSCLTTLLHRKLYARSWRGLLASVECKKTPQNEFYYHIHALIDGSYIPRIQLSRDWCQISGFPMVHIKRVWRTRDRAFKYVLKYVLKGYSFEDEDDKKDFKSSMRGVRYIRSYGSLYDLNYKTSPHVYFPCPRCGAVKCWVLEFDPLHVESRAVHTRYSSGFEPTLIEHSFEALKAANPLMQDAWIHWFLEHN